MLQDFSGSGNIDTFFCASIPGKLQHNIKVIPQNRGFGGAKGLLFQPVQILEQLFLRFLRQIQLQDILFVLGKFGIIIRFTGLNIIDPLISLVITAIIAVPTLKLIFNAISLIRRD